MIPLVSGLSHPFVSNELYSLAVEKALNESIILGDEPGYNYDFLSEQYPVMWNLQDLSEQVTEFLSMPKPKVAADETLWVFSVGAWDIWSLAALPLEVSEGIVGQLTYFVFEQIERLYQSSLDPKSIAWSTNRFVGETASKGSGELSLESEGANATALNATAATTDPATTTPMFRILIPKVFDPSLTPGWHSDRPLAPEVHSRAEQMRNAARLTQQWNQAIDIRMNVWVKSSGANPVTGVGSAADGIAQLAPPLAHPPLGGRPSPVMGFPSTTSAAAAASPSATQDSDAPLRDGFVYNLPEYIMKVIVDRQFRNAGLEDANGIGSELDTTSYVQVWEPCVGAEDEDDDDETEEGDDIEENGESDGGAAESICSAPDNYLFFTTFTLSRRAIAEIAWEAADLVLKNETVRSRIARIGMPI
ncbi:hypothetical protein GQ53DRAFT_668331 [Thozetella sp. PMI_491]|nr:hypothetical protein GQ53DRAFT_668331 [Thozetella sp. PMI_491]